MNKHTAIENMKGLIHLYPKNIEDEIDIVYIIKIINRKK